MIGFDELLDPPTRALLSVSLIYRLLCRLRITL